MKNINNLITKLLKENTISVNSFRQSFINKKPITISKQISPNGATITKSNILATDCDDDGNCTGTTDEGEEIQFTLDDVLSSLKEDNNNITLDSNTTGSADVKAVSKVIDSASNEGKTISFTENNSKRKLKEENTSFSNLSQRENVKNLLAWCKQNNLSFSNEKKYSKNLISYDIFGITKSPIKAFIEPNGYIKIGNVLIKDQIDFNNIISSLQENDNLQEDEEAFDIDSLITKVTILQYTLETKADAWKKVVSLLKQETLNKSQLQTISFKASSLLKVLDK